MIFSSSNISGYEDILNRVYPPYTPYIENYSNFCFSDFIVANSGMGSNIFSDNSYKRGKLLNEKSFDERNNLLFEKTISYDENLINTFSFYQSYTRKINNYSIDNNYYHLFSSKKDFKIVRFLPKSEIISTYDTAGNHIDETINYSYNNNGFIKTIKNLSSNGDTNKTEFSYPSDVTTSLTSIPGLAMSFSDNYFYRDFNTDNSINSRKAEIIQTSYYKNNVLNSYKRNRYDIYNAVTNFNNFISPRSIILGKGSIETQSLINIDNYDIDFNPVQHTTQNGTNVSVIWGYNKTKIIAKIENMMFSNISAETITNLQILSNTDFDNCKTSTCNEQILRNALNDLRTTLATSYPNARVTTYTHDPLVGVTSVTDPKTDVQYYTYDTFQRLIKVEDKNGKILTENEYNYKPQN